MAGGNPSMVQRQNVVASLSARAATSRQTNQDAAATATVTTAHRTSPFIIMDSLTSGESADLYGLHLPKSRQTE
jgi:hypothetical protein